MPNLVKNCTKNIKPFRVLLVEDDTVDQMTIERVFEKTNIANEVVKAKNGLEALDHMLGLNGKERLEWPYIILLDLNMPKMNGHEFLDEIRKYDTFSKIPVIVLTSSAREEDICASYGKYIAGYITKPVKIESFIEKMVAFGAYWAICELCDA